MPSILLSPLTGPIVDRYSRKLVIMGSDLTAGLATAILCLLWITNTLQVWHIYVAATVQSCCNALQWPAFMATISLLVPEDKLVKVNSWNQGANGLAMFRAPSISAWLLENKRFSFVFLFDFTSLLASCIVTLLATIPTPTTTSRQTTSSDPSQPNGSKDEGGGSNPSLRSNIRKIIRQLLADNSAALAFLQEKPGLLALLFLVGFIQLTNRFIQILFTPLLLSFADSSAIAGVLTLSGVGAMMGFALPIWWKGANKHRINIILAYIFIQGCFMLLLTTPKLSIILFVSFIYMSLVPLSRSSREATYQKHVPAVMQGRLFTLQMFLSKISLPLAAVGACPLCDYLFEPLVQRHPPLAWMAGGDQKGRGAALLAGILGAANMGMSMRMWLYRPLVQLDQER